MPDITGLRPGIPAQLSGNCREPLQYSQDCWSEQVEVSSRQPSLILPIERRP